jgi:TPR repeat protein
MSAEQGCLIGIHWMGVFYHLAFGVPKNLPKAVEYLTKAAKRGNGQSCYQLACLYANEEGEYLDIKKSYAFFEKALLYGVSMFDEFHGLFRAHFDVLAPIFLTVKKPTTMINKDNNEEVVKLHEAYVNEMKTAFSGALGKDRLYKRPVGFMQDQQIWMVGVLVRYFVKQVLHFDHTDFLKAVKEDIQPLLGELGLWSLTNYSMR